jgi:dolichyl-phosphate-mannose--protein O-mannosyl transferase
MLQRLQRSNDAVIATALWIASFIVLYIRYWVPPEKIFDEIYFARAAEEYLQRRYIYENTHPPVTKLFITLSTIIFGGLPGGDTSYGWRFLGVVAGATAVVLAFILARRITHSTIFGAYAAVLFACDGMHFVQSRIATPETYVVCFSLLTVYAFCRYWDSVAESPPRALLLGTWIPSVLEGFTALALGTAFTIVRFAHETLPAKIVAALVIAAALFAVSRLVQTRPAGWPWMLAFAFSAALLVASKWYGVMAYGVAAVVVTYVSVRAWRAGRESPFPVATVAAAVVAAVGIVYALAYIPHFIGLRDLQTLPPRPYTLSNIVDMQVNAYLYHSTLKATHPYQSVWWQWPLDWRPVLYYASYGNWGTIPTAAMIYSLANPVILWAGLFAVPFTAWLAYTRRDRGYALIVLAYLFQWLPWIFSPRIAFAYHFYVNVPLTAICDTVAAQYLYQRFRLRWPAIVFLALAAAQFVLYFPLYAAIPIPQWLWHRLMLPTWY